MFEIGQKVMLLTSTYKKNSIGPKKGSTGYVSMVDHTQKLKNMAVYISRVNIVFTRYGLSGDVRSEQKNVVSIFPLFQNNTSVRERTKLFVEAQDKEASSTVLAEEIKKQFGLDYVNTVIVPVNDRVNLLTCSNQEFVGWLNSLLLSDLTRQYLIDITQHQKAGDRFKGAFDIASINDLCNMAYDKDTKYKLLPTIIKDIKRRESIISALRTVLATGIPRQDARILDFFQEGIEAGSFGGQTCHMNKINVRLLPYIYNKNLWSGVKKLFIEKKIGSINKKFIKFTEEVEEIQQELGSLSRSLRSL